MPKVVLLNSGGLDSAMVAKYLYSKGYEVHSLFIDSNQINREATLKASQTTADRYCVSHKIISIDFGQCSNIYEENGVYKMYDELTELEKNDNSIRLYGCPALGLTFTSIATAYAKMIHAQEVFAGFKGHYNYNMQERFNDLSDSNSTAFYRVYLKAPLSNCMSYVDSMTLLGMTIEDLKYSHSCTYNEPCGKCPDCLHRAELGV